MRKTAAAAATTCADDDAEGARRESSARGPPSMTPTGTSSIRPRAAISSKRKSIRRARQLKAKASPVAIDAHQHKHSSETKEPSKSKTVKTLHRATQMVSKQQRLSSVADAVDGPEIALVTDRCPPESQIAASKYKIAAGIKVSEREPEKEPQTRQRAETLLPAPESYSIEERRPSASGSLGKGSTKVEVSSFDVKRPEMVPVQDRFPAGFDASDTADIAFMTSIEEHLMRRREGKLSDATIDVIPVETSSPCATSEACEAASPPVNGLGVGPHRIHGPGWQPGDDDTTVYSNGREGETQPDPETGIVLQAFTVPKKQHRTNSHDAERILQRMIRTAPLVPSQAIPPNKSSERKSAIMGFLSHHKRVLVVFLLTLILSGALLATLLVLLLPRDGVPESSVPESSVPESSVPESGNNCTDIENNSTSCNVTRTPFPDEATPAPTTTARFRSLKDLLLNISSPGALDDVASPQYRALYWLSEEDEANMTLSKTERLAQRYALVVLFYSTGGEYWTNNASFLSGVHECKWIEMVCDEDEEGCHFFYGAYRGVFCTGKKVRSIGLGANNLSGTLPAYELSSLSALQHLSLGENSLTGGLDSSVGNMKELLILDLQNNFITGTIPVFDRYHKMTDLYLWSNLFSGTIHDGMPRSIVEMPIADNVLSGTLPPSLGALKDVWFLAFGKNNITGSIPESLGALPNLEVFEAIENHLTGSIPLFFEKTNIRALALGHNELQGTIPSRIGLAPKLQGLSLEGNALSGTIPPFETGNLLGLSLNSNKLTGTIPASLGTNINLGYLELGDNQLEGRLPDTFSYLTSLLWISLRRNNLTGDLGVLCSIQGALLQADCGGPDPEVSCDCCTMPKFCCRDDNDECGLTFDIYNLIWDCYYGDDQYCNFPI